MAFSEILNSLGSIFVLLLPGFLFNRFKLIKEEHINGISNVLLYLVWPAVLFNALQIPFSQEMFTYSQKIFLFMVIIILLAFVCSFAIGKIIKEEKIRIFLFCNLCIFSNTGAMGLPVISTLYGNEGLFYASIVDMTSNIMLFTLGATLIMRSAGSTEKRSIKSFFSPTIIAIIVGYLLFLVDIQMPPVIHSAVEKVASASPALSMFVVGYLLGNLKLQEFLGDLRVYVAVFIRLIFVPLIAFIIFHIILKDNSLMAKVVTMEIAMPAANTSAVLAQKYKGDVSFITRGILISTLLSIITTSIWAYLIELFYI